MDNQRGILRESSLTTTLVETVRLTTTPQRVLSVPTDQRENQEGLTNRQRREYTKRVKEIRQVQRTATLTRVLSAPAKPNKLDHLTIKENKSILKAH